MILILYLYAMWLSWYFMFNFPNEKSKSSIENVFFHFSFVFMRYYRSKVYGYIFFPCHLSGLPFAKAACHRLNDPRDTPRRDLISSALVLLFLYFILSFFSSFPQYVCYRQTNTWLWTKHVNVSSNVHKNVDVERLKDHMLKLTRHPHKYYTK